MDKTEWIAMEFHGNGDRFFGGSADDRVLGRDGKFLTGFHTRDDYGAFPSKAEALAAAEQAANRRDGGLLAALKK